MLKLLLMMAFLAVGFVGCNYEPEFAELENPEDLAGNPSGIPGSGSGGSPSPTPTPAPLPTPEPTPNPEPTPGPNLISQADEFSQNTGDTINKVDIVWIVDDSGSMGDDQESIANNFSAFIDEFLTQAKDFKMGITTTDIFRKNGKFVHDLELLTSVKAAENESQFKQDFRDEIKVGTRGSGREFAFDNMVESTIHSFNQNFFRDDALLAFVVVTDEPEQGEDTVQQYYDDLLAFKGGDKNLVKVYPIHRVFGTSKDQRFKDIADLSGGFTADIQGDFYKNLRDIGGTILNLIGSFILTQKPFNPSAIEVFVEGVKVTSGWSYKSNANSIVFDEGQVPEEGAKVKVVYEYEQ